MLTQIIRPVISGIIVIVWGGLAITACGGSAAPAEDIQPMSEIVSQSAETPAPPAPALTPTAMPSEIIEPVSPIVPASPLPTPMPEGETAMPAAENSQPRPLPGSDEALAAAMADLAEQTGLPIEQIKLVSVEAIEWRDTSLGCPQEGYMYAQVITPGYLIMLQADGQTWEYHTDQKTNVVLCQENQNQ